MKQTMFCPICENTHEVEKLDKEVTVSYTGKTATCTQTVFVCEETGERVEFENGRMFDENMRSIREALSMPIKRKENYGN